MKRKLLIGIAGLALIGAIVALVIMLMGRPIVIVDSFSGGDLGSGMKVDVLVMATSIRRAANSNRTGDSILYPTYEISGLTVVARAVPNDTDATGPTGEFPPLGSTQWVAGHALIGAITPVPDLDGQLLAGLSVWSTGFESEGLPLWHFGWIAEIRDGGDVQIYEGGEDLWDVQLASLADLLGRSDQAALIVNWVEERHSERQGASTGPITLRFEGAFPTG